MLPQQGRLLLSNHGDLYDIIIRKDNLFPFRFRLLIKDVAHDFVFSGLEFYGVQLVYRWIFLPQSAYSLIDRSLCFYASFL